MSEQEPTDIEGSVGPYDPYIHAGQLEQELADLKAKYQKAVEEYDGLGVRYNKALAAIIILVDDAEFYSEDVRKLTSFSRIKDLAAELGEKE